MPMLLQHLLVLLLVGGCFAFVAVQGYKSLMGKRSKIGSCCAKGCAPEEPAAAKTTAANRVLFYPSDMLTSSARRSK